MKVYLKKENRNKNTSVLNIKKVVLIYLFVVK